jgi:hypothetical protein
MNSLEEEYFLKERDSGTGLAVYISDCKHQS